MVAATAAAVFIQTSSSLQSKALFVGSDSAKKVSSGIQITQVIYEKTSFPGSEGLEISMHLLPGSDPINISNAKLRVATPRWSFTSLQFGANAQSGKPDCSFPSGGQFLGIQGNTSAYTGALHPGEILTLCVEAVQAGSGILESDEFSVEVISPAAHLLQKFVMPPAITSTLTSIYP